MRKEIIIRLQPESEKCRRKALKVAASVGDVESVWMTGREKDLLLVVGDVDESALMKKLKDEVGEAEIMELRALPPGDALVVTQSPYQQQWRHYDSTPGRSVDEYPVAAARQAGYYYYPSSPSPLQQHQHHYPSPVAGQAARYGYAGSSSSYALAAARSHPANYSPMIARHDDARRAAGRMSRAADAGRGREHAGGGPGCCSIL